MQILLQGAQELVHARHPFFDLRGDAIPHEDLFNFQVFVGAGLGSHGHLSVEGLQVLGNGTLVALQLRGEDVAGLEGAGGGLELDWRFRAILKTAYALIDDPECPCELLLLPLQLL